MLGHLRRSLRAFHRLPAVGLAACDPIPLHRPKLFAPLAQLFSPYLIGVTSMLPEISALPKKLPEVVYITKRSYKQLRLLRCELKNFIFFSQDTDIIIDHIKKSTRELEQGPIGKNLSSAEKRKFLVNTLLGLEESREAVYGTLDAWVAFEQDFPLASLKQALSALEKEEQWHRIVQVIKWMLSKGQGNTMRTYEQLVCALEKDNRAEEAHKIWQKKIAHDLQSVPWRFCHLMLAIYYRNNRLERLVKLFKELEACGRKPPSKDIIRKVEDAYEMLGLLEEKKALLEKYQDLYNKPSRDDRKKGSKSKRVDMNKTGG
nr:unnamed protein product [Digitaria exilis]